MRLIGFAGGMGSGKDTACAALAQLGYARRAFADKLRVEVYDAIESGYEPDEMPDHIRLALHKCYLRDIFTKPTPDCARIVLQWWGAWRRSRWDAYWISPVFYELSPQGRYAFSDIRYANEAQTIQRCGGVVLKLEGRGGHGGIAGHESELIDFPCDGVIRNDGTLAQFESAVLQVALRLNSTSSAPASSAD